MSCDSDAITNNGKDSQSASTGYVYFTFYESFSIVHTRKSNNVAEIN